MSFDEWSHENNPIKILHEILKFMSFDKFSHENNPIKMLHEILKCLLTSALMKITQYKYYMKFSDVFGPTFSHAVTYQTRGASYRMILIRMEMSHTIGNG